MSHETNQGIENPAIDESLFEAYLVDDKGNEVPITQDMIDRAAKVLEKCLTPFACYQA